MKHSNLAKSEILAESSGPRSVMPTVKIEFLPEEYLIRIDAGTDPDLRELTESLPEKVIGLQVDFRDGFAFLPYQPARLARILNFYGEAAQSHFSLSLVDFWDEMLRRAYSKTTCRVYWKYNYEFLEYCGKKPEQVTPRDLRRFFMKLSLNRTPAASTLNTIFAALRFHYETILADKEFDSFRRPPGAPTKDRQEPPRFLSRTQVRDIILAPESLAHRAMFALLYCGGLRVGELTRLRVEDLDPSMMLIRIRSAGVRSERFTPLSDFALRIVENYLMELDVPEEDQTERQPDHSAEVSELILENKRRRWRESADWLFPGREQNRPLGSRTVERVFVRALEKAGLSPGWKIYDLRHAFAVHYLEDGGARELLREMLGLGHIRSLDRYRVDPPDKSESET